LAPRDEEIDVEELRAMRAALADTALNAFAGVSVRFNYGDP
jgi:hypothetical protein